MPYIGKKPENIIATAIDSTTGTFSGAVSAASVDADGGVTIDNITIDGTEIDLSSGDLTVDVAGDITLDADGGNIKLSDGGTQFGDLFQSSTDFFIKSTANDRDIIFQGVDNGSAFTAMSLDMSDAGTAIFNHNVKLAVDNSFLSVGASDDLIIFHDGTDSHVFNSTGDIIINSAASDKDLIFKGSDDGSAITALTLDMSDAGTATFNHDVILPYNGVLAFNSTSNQYITANSSNLYIGSGNLARIIIDTNGHVTMPTQPAFSAIATGQTDLAASSVLQIGFAGSERFDQNSDFNTSNSTFTAPVTGKYQFNVGIRVKAIDTGAGYVLIRLNTSNANYDHIFDSDEFSSDLDFSFFAFSILADMDASDTCIVQFFQNGGTQQADIDGASYFNGYLVA
jgi:hypothetical protein